MTPAEIAKLPTPRTEELLELMVDEARSWAITNHCQSIEQKLAAAVMALELALKWTHVHSEEAEADEKRIIETLAAIKEMG